MNNVIGFSARVLNPDDKPKYLNSAEHKAFEKSKVLYGLNFAKSAIRSHEKLIVVEGQMDVLGLAKLGFPIGVATSGTSLTEDHIKILKRYTENIYLMFDNDSAGQQATQRALKLFYQQNLFPKIISLPQGSKDIDDLANTENGKSAFEECLSKAKDGFLLSYQQLREGLDMTSPIDKQKLINTLFDLILSVNSLTIQEHYKGLLAEKLGFAFEILDAQFKRYKAGEGRLQLFQQTRKQQQNEKFQLEREWIFAALFYQEQISKYLGNNQQNQCLVRFAQLLAQSDPESLLARTIQGQLLEAEQQKLEELSLRRDQQLEEVNDTEKRYHLILQTLHSSLQKFLQFALKNPAVPASTKTELLELRKQI